MRQIGDDFRPDPFKPVKLSNIEQPTMSAQDLAQWRQYTRNQFLEHSYKYCSDKSGLTAKIDGTISEGMQQAFNRCLTKYKGTFGLLIEEQDIYQKNIQ